MSNYCLLLCVLKPSVVPPPVSCGRSCPVWAEMDSNHRSRRQQIYSLPHLATLVSARTAAHRCAGCCASFLFRSPLKVLKLRFSGRYPSVCRVLRTTKLRIICKYANITCQNQPFREKITLFHRLKRSAKGRNRPQRYNLFFE